MNAIRRKSVAFMEFICVVFILWNNSNFATLGMNVGFYCNDTTIQKPYSGDTVKPVVLLSSLLCGAPVTMYLSGYLSKKSMDKTQISQGSSSEHLKYFYSGFIYVLTITEFLKVAFTELRPHFITTCQPEIGQMKCSDGLITNFNCSGNGSRWLIEIDIYRSFPSGHASLSFYTFVFLGINVFALLKGSINRVALVWKMCVPLIFLIWSIVCSVSRILDNRHFWWDVLFGILLGLIVGFVMGTHSLRRGIGKQQRRNNKLELKDVNIIDKRK